MNMPLQVLVVEDSRTVRERNDTFWRSDGSPVAVETTMTPILERGEVVGTVLAFFDVRERRDAEEAYRSARRAAEP